MVAISFDNVCKVFGKNPGEAMDAFAHGESREDVLRSTSNLVAAWNVTLDVARGEIFILMGSSGSGKSTLLRCINSLIPITSGRLRIAHGNRLVDISACSPAELRALRQSAVSMVFQKPALLPWRTVAGNVGLGLELKGKKRKEILPIVKEKLELVGLEAWANKRPSELSGGMQQRVGLARALATDAQILLLDEPFSALDPLNRTRLQEEVLRLQKQLHRTMVFVTHDVNEALKLGTRIAFMDAGKIEQVGTPEQVLFQPASQLVREFVGNINPSQVLSVRTCMRPLEKLTRGTIKQTVQLDREGHVVAELESDNRLRQVTVDGVPQESITVAPEQPLNTVLRELPRQPIPVVNAAGVMVGVLLPGDIWRAVTSQPLDP
jgi:glycine betaine/proline transport system ATP-binding protein